MKSQKSFNIYFLRYIYIFISKSIVESQVILGSVIQSSQKEYLECLNLLLKNVTLISVMQPKFSCCLLNTCLILCCIFLSLKLSTSFLQTYDLSSTFLYFTNTSIKILHFVIQK